MSANFITVTCAKCGHEQDEPSAVISTVCAKCQSYIPVDRPNAVVSHAVPKRTRAIVCPHCERPQKVYPQALTMMCTHCGTHVNISNHVVSGQFRHSLATYGEVTFVKGCRYSGTEVRAQVIHASGDLRTRLKAYEDLIFRHRTVVTGPISAGNIIVKPDAQVHARRMQGTVIEVQGYLNIDSLIASQKLIVVDRGYLTAKSIKSPEIEVRSGGGLEGDFESIPLPASF